MDTQAVLELLQAVSAEVVEPRFRALEDDQVMEKNPGDLVTVADREAEVLLTDALNRAYPDALVLGEEAASADPSLLERYAAASHAFTVDPVDGTKNFVRGSKDHAVMVSEVREGEVVRSWIWHPQHRVAYVAEKGAGAWRDGERLHRPEREPQRPLRGVTSHLPWVGEALDGQPPLELTWISCGIDYARLAEGAADYVLYRGVTVGGQRRGLPWDHAPGSLLLSEAGGVVTLFGGAAYDPRVLPEDGLLAAGDDATGTLVRGLLPVR